MRFLTRSTLTVMLSGAIACSPAYGQNAAGQPRDVIAIVNGTEITADQAGNIDLDLLTPQQQKQVIDSLIIRQLLLEQALREGFDKQDRIVAAIKSLTEIHIVTQYIAELAAGFDVSDEVLRSLYDAEFSSSEKKYKVSHILLTTEEEGQALIAMLARGDDFAELAGQLSQDMVSAQKGGDLGWLASEDMAPSLYRDISGLSKGEVSRSPVHSPFGWHVLKLEGIRSVVPPKFEDVKPIIRKQLIEKKVLEYMENLKADAIIEIK